MLVNKNTTRYHNSQMPTIEQSSHWEVEERGKMPSLEQIVLGFSQAMKITDVFFINMATLRSPGLRVKLLVGCM